MGTDCPGIVGIIYRVHEDAREDEPIGRSIPTAYCGSAWSGFGCGFCAGFDHQFICFGQGLGGGDFRTGFVDVVDVERAVHGDDSGTGFGAGTLVHVNVLGGEIVVVAVGKEDGFFILHGNFEKSAERDDAFVDAVPVPGNHAAGGELDLDDGGAFVGVASEDGEGDAIRRAMGGGVFLRRGFADDGFVGNFLSGDYARQKN